MTDLASVNKLLLPVRDAAAALSISERKLWQISAPRGPVPTVKIGTRILYDPADLARFIESLKTGGQK